MICDIVSNPCSPLALISSDPTLLCIYDSSLPQGWKSRLEAFIEDVQRWKLISTTNSLLKSYRPECPFSDGYIYLCTRSSFFYSVLGLWDAQMPGNTNPWHQARCSQSGYLILNTRVSIAGAPISILSWDFCIYLTWFSLFAFVFWYLWHF